MQARVFDPSGSASARPAIAADLPPLSPPPGAPPSEPAAACSECCGSAGPAASVDGAMAPPVLRYNQQMVAQELLLMGARQAGCILVLVDKDGCWHRFKDVPSSHHAGFWLPKIAALVQMHKH